MDIEKMHIFAGATVPYRIKREPGESPGQFPQKNMAVRFIDRMMFPVVLTVSALTAFLLSAAPVAYGARVSPAERARAAAVYDMPASAADTIPEEDTVYALDEVMVVATRTSQEIVPVQMLSGEKLRTLGTHSIADAIRYFSGVQIKDYGGIGGLKTINVRSLGSQHVGVFYDGVELGNAQNGIVDLGRFSLDNMEEELDSPVGQGLRLGDGGLSADQEAPL